MIYSALLLNSSTKVVVSRVQLDDSKVLNLPSGIELSSRHDGDIGWTLLPNNEWYNPNPPIRWTVEQKVRNIRNFKLKQSDKYSYPDFPLTTEKRNEWLAYRQALRDITSQLDFPNTVIWPTKPE